MRQTTLSRRRALLHLFWPATAVLLLFSLLLVACSSEDKPDGGPQGPGAVAADRGPSPPCTDLPGLSGLDPLVPPGPEVPEEKAAFSGAWEGKNGDTYAALVVLSLSDKEATSFYAYGANRGRLVSPFQPDGSIHHGGSQQIQFTWTLAKNRATILATYIEGNNRSSYAMHRCTLLP